LARSVVVAAPGDTSPVTRLHAARLATTIAEFFRDQGKSVLFLMDSISRVAQAQREIGLAIGEPPTTKGYPPSVFTLIPNLMERAGNGHEDSQGAITAFYTVLAEGDDQQDPVVDAARSVLDGHIVLSRELASSGHYPAIDINQSISRLAPALQGLGQKQSGKQLRQWLNSYTENKDLITVGAYQAGRNILLDQALDKKLDMDRFLQQGMHDSCDMATSLDHLQILAQPPQHEFQQSETLQAMP
jgi:flagellum-specific ATP synthase